MKSLHSINTAILIILGFITITWFIFVGGLFFVVSGSAKSLFSAFIPFILQAILLFIGNGLTIKYADNNDSKQKFFETEDQEKYRKYVVISLLFYSLEWLAYYLIS